MPLDYLIEVSNQAKQQHHRFGVELIGSQEWSLKLIEQFLAKTNNYDIGSIAYKLGGKPVTWAKSLPKNGGAQLLGHDTNYVIYDAVDGIDANSLTASAGTVVGGGLLFIIHRSDKDAQLNSSANLVNYGEQWLDACFVNLIQIKQVDPDPNTVTAGKLPEHRMTEIIEQAGDVASLVDYSEQQAAIASIGKVVTGHRKRPLVLTADRGRGKSAALGMAAAQLMETRDIAIIVTAPSVKSVSTVFKHAELSLDGATREKLQLTFGGSTIQFVAPDELLSSRPNCDLLLVDEAAAIPVPMLKAMVSTYHRLVFSSTVHGYEGCGRGFTLRFLPWLQDARPGGRHLHLSQPMRWAKKDPLENWLFGSFLLNAELPALSQSNQGAVPEFRKISQKELLANQCLLQACFALLVNAHYQTSPNDLLHLLSDDSVTLYGGFSNGECVACVTTVKEGNIEASLVEDIGKGKRRPKGHLVPTTIINHLGDSEVASLTCHRVMRIAVHPELQRQSVGSQFIGWLVSRVESENAYVATSFGASPYLLDFWLHCGFQPIWLGSSKDQASGCFSVVMVHLSESMPHQWARESQAYWAQNFSLLLSSTYRDLNVDIVARFLNYCVGGTPTNRELIHLRHYVSGGASMDSIMCAARKLVLHVAPNPSERVLLAAYFQLQDWPSLSARFNLSGRKQTEALIRHSLDGLLYRFTV
ncbi:GNAT family N-acetyltransferase [Vibrio tapetis subsp. quintayensis]|uniref:GNAT family N-acetyltransferase n=1 Tax=Vibrio tapetis TaxID=52443 RepID=UPI0025B43400|nr:GNAT family N-acetyltransferase [Vibrio tapetis]MDN3682020.1 GNAT family N-acetyltransferase [Vibrio tapetis subsp. quintayensis]